MIGWLGIAYGVIWCAVTLAAVLLILAGGLVLETRGSRGRDDW